ncbi:MAG: hypothetical protein P0S94_01275 [Simkaniaceae bacterium]|nr:hypothetical protein [Simkaniaceae bacterium]
MSQETDKAKLLSKEITGVGQSRRRFKAHYTRLLHNYCKRFLEIEKDSGKKREYELKKAGIPTYFSSIPFRYRALEERAKKKSSLPEITKWQIAHSQNLLGKLSRSGKDVRIQFRVLADLNKID